VHCLPTESDKRVSEREERLPFRFTQRCQTQPPVRREAGIKKAKKERQKDSLFAPAAAVVVHINSHTQTASVIY
jgi:hypothetical protein